MGVDRSGPPPPQTLPGAPLNLWTIPNAIGMVRLGLLPIFLAVSFSSDSGIGVWPAVLFGVAGWSDRVSRPMIPTRGCTPSARG